MRIKVVSYFKELFNFLYLRKYFSKIMDFRRLERIMEPLDDGQILCTSFGRILSFCRLTRARIFNM